MPMNWLPWAVMGYVFAFGLATPMLMELPSRLASGRINRRGFRGRAVTPGMGLGLVFALQVLGFVCWFVACLVPIMLSASMNRLYAPAFWFGTPFMLGVILIALIRINSKRPRRR